MTDADETFLRAIEAALDAMRMNADLPEAAQRECYEAMVYVAKVRKWGRRPS